MFCFIFGAATARAADSREVGVKKARAEFWKSWDTRDATGMAANRNLDDVVDSRVRFYGTVAIVTYSLHLEADAAGSIDVAAPRPRFPK